MTGQCGSCGVQQNNNMPVDRKWRGVSGTEPQGRGGRANGSSRVTVNSCWRSQIKTNVGAIWQLTMLQSVTIGFSACTKFARMMQAHDMSHREREREENHVGLQLVFVWSRLEE